jgi:hypothetical protein
MAPVGLAVIERSIANLWILCIPGTLNRILFYPLLTLLLFVGSATATPTLNLSQHTVYPPYAYGLDDLDNQFARLTPADRLPVIKRPRLYRKVKGTGSPG